MDFTVCRHVDRPAPPLSFEPVSNAPGKKPSREEEIAFLALEQVLEVDIESADAGAGDKKPDGAWTCPDEQGRRGIVEVTSPPAEDLMAAHARAKKAGERQTEEGSIALRWNELAQVCSELLSEDWARDNFDKLLAEPADERHLFLFARSYEDGDYFYRLSDSYDGVTEHIDDLVLPAGITDVWFSGRSRRDLDQRLGTMELWLARFQAGSGWHRYKVHIKEQSLPAPNPGLADDLAPEGWRSPKDRRKQATAG